MMLEGKQYRFLERLLWWYLKKRYEALYKAGFDAGYRHGAVDARRTMREAVDEVLYEHYETMRK